MQLGIVFFIATVAQAESQKNNTVNAAYSTHGGITGCGADRPG